MSKCECSSASSFLGPVAWSRALVAAGIASSLVTKLGFWKAVMYGMFWEIFVGQKIAEWIWGK